MISDLNNSVDQVIETDRNDRHFLSNRREKKEIPQLRQFKPRQTPDVIVEAVCQEFNCQADQILRKGAKKNRARDVAIYLARELSGESGVDLGK